MLAAVAEWPKTRSCQSTANVHRDLLEAIRDDFAKYAGNREKIVKVFAALPRLVGRKFQPRKVDSEEKTLPLRNAFRMLSHALRLPCAEPLPTVSPSERKLTSNMKKSAC